MFLIHHKYSQREAMRETVASLRRSETIIYVYIFTADQCFSLLVVSALAIKLIEFRLQFLGYL
jgi:hypothetical protein